MNITKTKSERGLNMIKYDDKLKIFKLDTINTSYIFGLDDEAGYLCHYYYGKKLESVDVRYLSRLYDGKYLPGVNARDKNGFSDVAPFEFSTGGIGDFRPHALEIVDKNGSIACELFYDSHRIYEGKEALTGLPATFSNKKGDVQTLEITLKDKILKLAVKLSYSVFSDTDAIVRSVKVINEGSDSVNITKIMSLSLDLDNEDFDLLSLHGSWGRERTMEYRDLGHGFTGVSSQRGVSSHQEHPFIALTSKNITQTEGSVYAFNLVYSGSFEAVAHRNQFDLVRVLLGISPYNFKWELKPGDEFIAPEAVMVHSFKGLSAMTTAFHELYRNHLIRSPYLHKKRPVLINNWEGTYFDFDTEKLVNIAKEAAKGGIEMLVMDDGWFGNRFDDNRALGDWKVNEEKLPGGLKELVRRVNDLGLKFGIWMEPEMVNPDSDLYRAHPDWAFEIPGRDPSLSRNQLVLDITRQEVFDYVWNCVESTLKSANIEYLKWDMNRALCDIYSAGLPADRQGEIMHRYVLSVYKLQEKLITTFPEFLLENCSSGGGRFDPGMLYYSPQIWTSDNTDAGARLLIQEGTALIYPLSTMGAHVSVCPNHAMGRNTPFETRGNVALAGTFGYELDTTKFTDEEREMVKEQVKTYHKYNDLVREGDYYRLASLRENGVYDAWMVKSKDDKEILVTFVLANKVCNVKGRKIKLLGLNEAYKYVDEETKVVYGADVLSNAGILISDMWGDYQSKLIHLTKV